MYNLYVTEHRFFNVATFIFSMSKQMLCQTSKPHVCSINVKCTINVVTEFKCFLYFSKSTIMFVLQISSSYIPVFTFAG